MRGITRLNVEESRARYLLASTTTFDVLNHGDNSTSFFYFDRVVTKFHVIRTANYPRVWNLSSINSKDQSFARGTLRKQHNLHTRLMKGMERNYHSLDRNERNAINRRSSFLLLLPFVLDVNLTSASKQSRRLHSKVLFSFPKHCARERERETKAFKVMRRRREISDWRNGIIEEGGKRKGRPTYKRE